VRRTHLPNPAAWLTIVALLCGPATGLERAIHLAEAGDHHAAEDCAVCIDLAIGATADELPSPATLTELLPACDRWTVAAQCTFNAVAGATPLAPRAPPV